AHRDDCVVIVVAGDGELYPERHHGGAIERRRPQVKDVVRPGRRREGEHHQGRRPCCRRGEGHAVERNGGFWLHHTEDAVTFGRWERSIPGLAERRCPALSSMSWPPRPSDASQRGR